MAVLWFWCRIMKMLLKGEYRFGREPRGHFVLFDFVAL